MSAPMIFQGFPGILYELFSVKAASAKNKDMWDGFYNIFNIHVHIYPVNRLMGL